MRTVTSGRSLPCIYIYFRFMSFLLKLQTRRNVFTARYFVLTYSDNLVNMEICVERARNLAAARTAHVYKTHKKPNLYFLPAFCSILTFRKKLFNEGFAPRIFPANLLRISNQTRSTLPQSVTGRMLYWLPTLSALFTRIIIK